MDMSSSLDVLVRRDVRPSSRTKSDDAMSAVVRQTKERMAASFSAKTIRATRKK